MAVWSLICDASIAAYSCNSPAGLAYILYDTEYVPKLMGSDYVPVCLNSSAAELLAVCRGFEETLVRINSGECPDGVRICSDCRYVIIRILQYAGRESLKAEELYTLRKEVGSVAAREFEKFLQRYKELSEKLCLEICWVKGHQKNLPQIHADHMAKKARQHGCKKLEADFDD